MGLIPPDALGSRSSRFAAFVVDSLALFLVQRMGALMGAFVGAFVMTARHAPEAVVENAVRTGILLGWTFWGLAGWAINYVVLQGLTGSTLGKTLCGIKVLNVDGSPLGMPKSMARSMAYSLSSLPLYLGFAWILWDKRSQGLHDLICGTVVARKDWNVSGALAPVIPLPAPAADPDRRAA